MSPAIAAALNNYLHLVVAALLALAAMFFLFQFLLPSWRAGRQIKRAGMTLKALRSKGSVLDLDRVRAEAMRGDALQHCWDEFRDTLHGQKQANASGSLVVTRWRATATANNFFTEQALVDTPLRTEFYKHLPGILTGIGIIGTFSGLILGLQAFGKVNLGDADTARAGLGALLATVGNAFVVSGGAITLAMVLTTLEKLVVNGLHARVEALCRLVDSLFDAGAGEEYLQRLVEAAETSATQAMQMKESLVTDLKKVLTELTAQQIATITATNTQLGHTISTSLSEGLREPLARISDAVQSVSGSQGEAINKLLMDVMSNFSSQMESMFGGQMRGMSELLGQTAGTIQQASQRFEQLVGQIEQAGSGATQAMAKRMDEALAQMQLRQGQANDQMSSFIDQLKKGIAQGQSDSAELTMSMMKELSEATSSLVKGLQDQSRNAQQDQTRAQREATEHIRAVVQQLQDSVAVGQSTSANAAAELLARMGAATEAGVRSLQEQSSAAQQAQAARLAALAEDTDALLARQNDQVSRLADAVQRAEAAMRDTIERIKSSTDSHLERMATGAERLLGASDRLSENLSLMKSNSDGLSTSAEWLTTASGTLTQALNATQLTLGDQQAVREALAGMVADLRATIETAKREASVTEGLVAGMQQASQRLAEAQSVSVSSLEEATLAIGEAHGAFAKQVEVTLREGNRVFHEELAQAVGVLKGAIQDLGDVLDNLPSPA